MAHSCPECHQVCYCNGDIDDCLFDFEEDVQGCTHCCGDEHDDEDTYGIEEEYGETEES